MNPATPTPPPQRSLFRKLAEVMAALGPVQKTGRHEVQDYAYTTGSDVFAAVRGLMAARSLMLVPSVTSTTWRKVTGKGAVPPICMLVVKCTVHDGESGEQMDFDVVAEAQDVADKAALKAQALAVKHALEKLFLIPNSYAGTPLSPAAAYDAAAQEPKTIAKTLLDEISEAERGGSWQRLNAVATALERHAKVGDITEIQRKMFTGKVAAAKAKVPTPPAALAQADSAS